MTSPEHTAATEDHEVPAASVRRSRTSLRIFGPFLAVAALAFASTACTPVDTAHDAIARYWGPYVACAEKIVARESGFNASAVNPVSGATGLFQIHPTHATWIKATYGYTFAEMKDPYKNSRVAKGLSSEAYRYWRDGWQPWRLGGRSAPNGGCPA